MNAGHVLVTGGAGFVGTNLAHRLLRDGRSVTVLDSLARPGVERNLRWLTSVHGGRVRVEIADVLDRTAVTRAMRGADSVYHLAAQVAVTSSIRQPLQDFEVNARGTLNVLEAARAQEPPPAVFFTSTNKVYGALEDVALSRRALRYEPCDGAIRRDGINESRGLDFHSPYGCSKGAADQYVLDYSRTFGIPAVVFRMSCIYGPHQFGTEDQGWVAHFLISALEGRTITVFGDGCQVRDLLYVDDLVEALLMARERIKVTSGQAFNIGGGSPNSASLLEVLDRVAKLQGSRPVIESGEWRTGDQRYYVSDTSKFRAATGWQPRVGLAEGLESLHAWLIEHRRGAPAARSGVVDALVGSPAGPHELEASAEPS